jgi:flagellin
MTKRALTGKKPDLTKREKGLLTMLSIQTNVNSLVAQQNLVTNSIFQSKTIQQLTSGYRINSSGDDAAGLAVANKFRSSVAELTQGVANANDGVASLQIMDGGMNNISQMLDRLKTLAMQSASGSFTGGTTGRAQLNSEFQSDILEINRQAESIGLNTAGAFAKNLAVYLGAGAGSGTDASNSVVNVDLSKAIVDSQSLGLQGVQATNGTEYDLSQGTTTVQAIATTGANTASLTNGYSYMTFTGPGYGDTNGVKISINMAGVGDTNGLVTAVNAAIQNVSGATSAGANFKSDNITATIFTNTDGKQQLAFNSSSSAFTVRGNDLMANALLGSFNAGGPTGSSILAATSVSTGTATAGTTLSGGGTIVITGLGMTSAITITLAANSTSGDAITALESAGSAIQAAGLSISGASATKLQVDTNSNYKGDGWSISWVGAGTAVQNSAAATAIGLSTAVTGGATFYASVSSGAYQATSSTAAPTAIAWADQAAGDQQTISFTAQDAAGGGHSTSVTLANASGTGTGSSVDEAINAINTKLQQSNDSTLQQIVAVKSETGGTQSIQFVSTLSNFTVSTGTNTTASKGANSSQVSTPTMFHSAKSGTGGTADISSIGNAQTAVSAITTAVGLLGSAQANVGKGQNQLQFAMSLAESQITNLSTAQSYIRDANVAQQAANLTKAQVLQQASIAAMAQANSAPQAVLTLLRG